MENKKLTNLLMELEKAIADIYGPDWGKSNIDEISNNFIELCYKIENEFTKDEEIIDAIDSFKVDNNLIFEEETNISHTVLEKRKVEENSPQEVQTKRAKISFDSITSVQFIDKLAKTSHSLMSQSVAKVLSNVPQVGKDEALTSLQKKIDTHKSEARTLFQKNPNCAEDIFNKYRQNIKIEIGKIFVEFKQKFPGTLIINHSLHRSLLEDANLEINWDLRDIRNSKSGYVLCNLKYYEQQKEFSKKIDKFFTKGSVRYEGLSKLLKKFLFELDIEQDKKDKILVNIEQKIKEAQTLAKESFIPDDDQQNNKTLTECKIKIISIIIEKITNLKLEIDSQSTSNNESMNKLFDNFITKISAKLERQKKNAKNLEELDNVEAVESNDSDANKSLSNSAEKIGGDKLSSQDSSKKEEFKLVLQENSDNNHDDIIVKIQIIEEFNNLPELLIKFFTRFKEFIESFPKAMEEYLSCTKNKFIIISSGNLEMGSHAKSEEVVYKGENLPDSKPKILVGDIPIPFEFTPERSSMDILSLIQENSVNGLINEMFNAREIFF